MVPRDPGEVLMENKVARTYLRRADLEQCSLSNLWMRTFSVNDMGATPTTDWTSVPVRSTVCASLHDGACYNGLDVVLQICEGQPQVEPYPSEHHPPSRRLQHWRHHQWNFMIPYSRMHNDRFSCRVTSKHNSQLDWLCWKHANVAFVEEVLAVRERDTVLQVMTFPARLEAVIASLTTATKERVVSEHVEALGKEPST